MYRIMFLQISKGWGVPPGSANDIHDSLYKPLSYLIKSLFSYDIELYLLLFNYQVTPTSNYI